jgi:hypothetical protein
VAFPVYTIKDLADFSNQPESYFTSYANTALTQASLLFRIATCLKDAPTDPDDLELMKNAILDMALKIYISSEYVDVQYKPFVSESIGSYSYAKALTKIKNGEETGVMWFDLAVGQMGVCDLVGGGAHSTGGVEVFEHDGTFAAGRYAGNERLLSPNDIPENPTLTFWR